MQRLASLTSTSIEILLVDVSSARRYSLRPHQSISLDLIQRQNLPLQAFISKAQSTTSQSCFFGLVMAF